MPSQEERLQRFGELVGAVITAVAKLQTVDLEELLAAFTRSETLAPILNPSFYMVHGEAMQVAREGVEAVLELRRRVDKLGDNALRLAAHMVEVAVDARQS